MNTRRISSQEYPPQNLYTQYIKVNKNYFSIDLIKILLYNYNISPTLDLKGGTNMAAKEKPAKATPVITDGKVLYVSNSGLKPHPGRPEEY